MPCAYHRARRPALVPPNCSLTPAETEELVRTRVHQPPFPPPDPRLLRHIRSVSPARTIPCGLASLQPDGPSLANELSEARNRRTTPHRDGGLDASVIPFSIAHDPSRRAAWLKARVHYIRDRQLQLFPSKTSEILPPTPPLSAQLPVALEFCPKRKHSAFVINEERKCRLEDRVGTPHLSEYGAGRRCDCSIAC
ncbi:hypothetical protein P154DRAFT_622696 [Amniculicola lignicola CBS 123094]|uniref:Uncharacterized protein n=1 Tax=Amniculicola lignicola CBS 123094 TaxID=1392246 RepID=A0A6A5W5F6_9PLEO|nr:hypothetical protein P154DRAFT_622696 [Amniculicola lignicola CBS 123094]